MRLSAEWTWEGLLAEVRELSQLEALSRKPLNARALDRLAQTPTNTLMGHPLGDWIYTGFGKATGREVAGLNLDVRHAWLDAQENPGEEMLVKRAQRKQEAFTQALNDLLTQAGPARYSFDGFKIRNPDRAPDKMLKEFHGAIQAISSIFKARGFIKLLHESVSQIELWLKPPYDGGTAHGHYYAREKKIIIYSAAFYSSSKRLWTNWVEEVLIHEIGHHIHYWLHPEAWEIWKAPWGEVEELETKQTKVSGQDRQRYWALLESSRWPNPSTVAKRLKGYDKIKFGTWLRYPSTPLITPKTFRLTKAGKAVFGFLADPEAVLREEFPLSAYMGDEELMAEDHQKTIARRVKMIKKRLLVEGYDQHNIPLDPMVVEQVKKEDPSVAEALAKLEIPSNYGQTNFKEDFAETFVAFVTNPSSLSETARFRMSQALAVSGLYGKTVGRYASLAERVAWRYLKSLA